MRSWYVGAWLDGLVTDDQAVEFAERLGVVSLETQDQKTEVGFYVDALSARQALTVGLDKVGAVIEAAGVSLPLVRVEAMTEAVRMSALNASIPELASTGEVQEILEIKSRQQLNEMANAGRLPKPIAELRSGRVWLRDDILKFKATWNLRRRGRTEVTA